MRRSLMALLDSGINPLTFFDRDHKKYFYLAECLALVDLSLMVKLGVQYSLWGGSVLNLGTEAHRRAYFDDIGSFKLPGCFAMTGEATPSLSFLLLVSLLSTLLSHTPDSSPLARVLSWPPPPTP